MIEGYYECHITMLGKVETIEKIVNKTHWHYSKIDGDPILDVGVKSYATINFKKTTTSLSDCVSNIESMANFLEKQNKNIRVIRTKIEEIVYDRRY